MSGEGSPSPTRLSELQFYADLWIHAVRRLGPSAIAFPPMSSDSPEGEPSRERILSWMGDVELLFVAATRLRRAAGLILRSGDGGPNMRRALDAFDAALPDLKSMRDIEEHFDDYALGRGRIVLDAPIGVHPDAVVMASEALYRAVLEAVPV